MHDIGDHLGINYLLVRLATTGNIEIKFHQMLRTSTSLWLQPIGMHHSHYNNHNNKWGQCSVHSDTNTIIYIIIIINYFVVYFPINNTCAAT